MSGDDPFSRLEEAVARQDQEERAGRALSRARVDLVLGKDAKSVFFATLALKLRPEPSWAIPTVMTDGSRLIYNPGFLLGLTEKQRVGVVAHEVMHNALSHQSRRAHRDLQQWNIACDLSVNPLIRESGLELPADARFPEQGSHQDLPRGLSAEEYYALLAPPTPPPPEGDGEGEGEGQGDAAPDPDPGKCGGVQDAGDGSPADARESQAEWEVAVAQAHQAASQRGKLPGGLERLIQGVLHPKVDWREVLREFVSRAAKNDFAWFPPNRRFIHQGLYLPGLRSEEIGDICLAVDTSGSIGPEMLTRFASEIQGILDGFECSLTILYHDASVQHVQTWSTQDGPLTLEAKGGGRDGPPPGLRVDRGARPGPRVPGVPHGSVLLVPGHPSRLPRPVGQHEPGAGGSLWLYRGDFLMEDSIVKRAERWRELAEELEDEAAWIEALPDDVVLSKDHVLHLDEVRVGALRLARAAEAILEQLRDDH